MLLKTQVIVNPESNKGKTRKRWKYIQEALKNFLREFKCEFTEKPFQATEISRTAIKEGTELVVGVGGDGTMNEIANGFYENREIINPETALGIVPSGTGCDFTRSLNIPSGLKDSLKVITQAPSSLIDIGSVRFKGNSGKEQERYFLNVADFGIGGEVVKKVNENRMKRKASSYLKCLLSTFINYKNKRLRIKIDDKELPIDEYMVGTISNGRIFGKGMKIAPEAELDDGLFDVVLIKRMKLFEFLRNVWKIYTGSHLSHPKISLIRGRKTEVFPAEDEGEVLIELDGEQLGTLPATFEIVPGSILVKGYP
ncbi:MAG: diacylglycerol kinase family lipid kinase [Candidatus Aminicenantes bacterium]|nr:MAG: diacylglycerol kinase family lipid kinase [Candidatus Aminicenantes bacterium]